jgi:steroid delta-isomerase-like uncharacterized protein
LRRGGHRPRTRKPELEAEMSGSEISRRWAEAVNTHDVEALVALYAPNAITRDPAYAGPLEGVDAIRKDFVDFFRAFPDVNVEARVAVEADGDFAVEATFSGTHQGPLPTPGGDLAPTGRSFRIGAAGFYHLDGQGRILDERRYYDLSGLVGQLQVTSTTGTTP